MTAPAREGCGWGRLYAIFAAAAVLCLGGYRLGTTPALARLLQVAVALVILALLTHWVRASHPTLLPAGDPVAAPARPPFAAIRIPLRSHRPRSGRASGALSAHPRARVFRLGTRHLP